MATKGSRGPVSEATREKIASSQRKRWARRGRADTISEQGLDDERSQSDPDEDTAELTPERPSSRAGMIFVSTLPYCTRRRLLGRR